MVVAGDVDSTPLISRCLHVVFFSYLLLRSIINNSWKTYEPQSNVVVQEFKVMLGHSTHNQWVGRSPPYTETWTPITGRKQVTCRYYTSSKGPFLTTLVPSPVLISFPFLSSESTS